MSALISHSSRQQQVVRELRDAFCDPGTVRNLRSASVDASALRAILAAVLDSGASLADPHCIVSDTDRALFGDRVKGAESARFIVVDGGLAPDFKATPGSAGNLGHDTTLLLQVDLLGAGPVTLRLAGTGFPPRRLRVDGLHPDWLAVRGEPFGNAALEVNVLLVDASRLAALPRTARVAISIGEPDAPFREKRCPPAMTARRSGLLTNAT